MINKLYDFYERHEAKCFYGCLSMIGGYMLFCVWVIYSEVR